MHPGLSNASGPGSALSPGTLVTPSIRLSRMLGRGGMGSVWVAEHLRLRTEVVVKFMAPEYAQNEDARRRFEREATFAAQAKSPNVVQVFDHGITESGLPYIVMEMLSGEDLGQCIEREGRIEPHVFAVWLRQACAGLGRAHQKGIVHRDIKPENVFLCDEDGEVLVKLLDFGIAKSDVQSVDFSGTRTGAVMGTAYYMSPEQTLGSKNLDARTDLWALGVVTYYALTGARPFEAEALGALVLAITQGPVIPPSSRNPRLDPRIDAFMARALARPLSERFQSAREMSDAFLEATGTSHVVGSLRPAPSGPIEDPARESSVHSIAATLPLVGSQSAAPARSGADTTMGPSVRSGKLNRGARSIPWLVALVLVGAAAMIATYLRSSASLDQPIAPAGSPATSFAPREPAPAPPTAMTSTTKVVPLDSGVLSVVPAPPRASAGVLPVRLVPRSPGAPTRARTTAAPEPPAAVRLSDPAPAAAPMSTAPPKATTPVKNNPLKMRLE
jgi:eukaryotic-like serine/threonine-protein kinase